MICFGPAYYKRVEGPSSDPIFGENAAGFYGKPIPVSCGTRRIPGVNLWASDFRTFTRKLVGGKFSIPDLDYYRNNPEHVIDLTLGQSLGPFCDFAVGFGYRGDAIDDAFKTLTVERIWCNDILVFDRALDTGVAYDGKETNEKVSLMPLDFVVYPGSETQMPDPTIKEIEGENTPAFRGMIYIVFRDYDISKTGGGIPFVRVQFADRAGGTNACAKFTKTVDDGGAADPALIQANWPKNQFTIWTATEAVTYNFSTLKEIKRVALDPEIVALLTTGNINTNSVYTFTVENVRRTVFTTAQASNARPVYLVDFENGVFINKIGWHDGQRPPTAGYPYIPGVQAFQLVTASIDDGRGLEAFDYGLIAVGGSFGGSYMQALRYDPVDDRISYLWGRTSNVVAGGGYIESVTTSGNNYGRSYGDAQYFFAAGNLIYTAYMKIDADRTYWKDEGAIPEEKPEGLSYFPLINLNTLEGIARPGVDFTVRRIWCDPSDANLVIWYMSNDGEAGVAKLYSDEYLANEIGSLKVPGQLVWKVTSVEYKPDSFTGFPPIPEAQKAQLKQVGSLIAYYAGNIYYEIDTLSGDARAKEAIFGTIKDGSGYTGFPGEGPGTVADPGIYGIVTARFVAGGPLPTADYSPARLLLDRSFNDRVPLSGLLKWLCRQAGYTNEQILVSGIDENVTGAIITQRVNINELLVQCAGFFGFDKFESAGRIALTRNAIGDSFDILATIPEGRLAELNGEGSGEYLYTDIRDENEIPSGVELRYLDETANYGIGLQIAQRTKYPVATTDSASFAKFSVPVIMRPGEALTYANRRLWAFNQERFYQQVRLPWDYINFEPSDVIEILKGGFEYALKVFEVMLNGDYSLNVSARRLALTVDKDYEAPTPIRPTLDVGSGLMVPLVFDVPGIPTPDGLEGIPIGYSAGPEDAETQYFPSFVYVRDSGEFRELARAGAPLPHGVVTQALSGSDDSISFKMYAGRASEFVEQDEDEALDGLYLIAVGAPGRWEFMSWRDVSYDEGSRIVTLSGLVRGFSGTDVYADTHRTTDKVALFDVNRMSIIMFDDERLGERVDFRAARTPVDLPFSPTVSLRLTGSAVAPFAPSSFVATYAEDEIVFTWQRRDRLYNDNLDDGTDTIGNAEGFEGYRLKIYNEADEVVRTIDDIAGPTYLYAAADIAEDFGELPTVITASVCQKGAVVTYGLENKRTMAIYS